MTAPSVLDVLEELITIVVDPAAAEVDEAGTSPRATVIALPDRIGRVWCGLPRSG
jgi:hypothetical protein